MQKETRLRIEISNNQPVELVDFTQAFLGVGGQYERFLLKHPEAGFAPDVKLYIKEIKTGSIITDLFATTICALPFIEDTNSVIAFTKYLQSAYYYFLGKSEKREDYDKIDYNQLTQIVGPVAKDSDSQINFNAQSTHGNIYCKFYLGSVEANAAQNTIRKELEELGIPETKRWKKVVLYLWQARKDLHSQAGDKGIIENISLGPVKIIFDNEDIKKAMLFQVENPFLSVYIVDVDVGTINGKPVLYKITHFHESFSRP